MDADQCSLSQHDNELTFDISSMSQIRSVRNEPAVVDDYPVQPNTVTPNDRTLPMELKNQKRTIALISFIYLLYGIGLSVQNLLYINLAKKNGLSSWLYGSVLASTHIMSVLFYPLSCRISSETAVRSSTSVSIFVVGSCQILFGTLYLIPGKTSFIILSYVIQFVEGIGISIFIASTVLVTGYLSKKQIRNFSFATQACMCLGLALGPPYGQVLNKELGFDIAFYIVGGLTVLCVILTSTILTEPEERIPYTDLPIVYWMSDKRALIYFFLMLESFIYAGFLTISLPSILIKFNLNKLVSAAIFSLAPIVYGFAIPGWKWLIQKGFNNVMMMFIGSLIVLASLILLGPAPFIPQETSLTFVCVALGLEGLGLALKCTCVLDASEKDLSYQKKHTKTQLKLIISTIVILGASLGYFFGLLTSGVMETYLGYRTATLPHFILEICTAIGVVILAMSRNYVSKRYREAVSESQPILRS